MTTPLPNASSINELTTPSFEDVYGDLSLDAIRAFITEGSMLPEGFRDIQVWRDLAGAMDDVFGANVGSLIRDLFGMNDVGYLTQSPTIDKNVLLSAAKRLGVTTDLNIFDIEDVRSFVRYSPEFWKEKGNRNFIQYMSFVVNALIEMKYLWTNDYENFHSEGADTIGTSITEGGTFYPTSHVYIVYDVNKFRGSVNANFSSQEALSKFFYSIAPIHLVIKSFLLNMVMDAGPLRYGISCQDRIYEGRPKSQTQNNVAQETAALRRSFNPKDISVSAMLMNSNLTVFGAALSPATQGANVRATQGFAIGGTTGRYFEFNVNSFASGQQHPYVGVGNANASLTNDLALDANAWILLCGNGQRRHNNATAAHGSKVETTQRGMCYVSGDGKIYWGKNGTWFSGNPSQGTSPAYSGLTGTVFPIARVVNNTTLLTVFLEASTQRYAPPTNGLPWVN